MACDKGFSSSYMLLKPEEVRFFDLIHILFSSDLEKRSFVECPKGTEETFRHRWFKFISIWAQKFLQLVATPLAFVGSGVEMWLNLMSSNRNFGVLLLNLLRGDPTSAISAIPSSRGDNKVKKQQAIEIQGSYTAMGWEKGAIRSYMLLKSKEASFSELVRILFSNDIKIRKTFVDCPKDTSENFLPRWPIFVSLVAQKSLQIVSKPMAKVGTAIERQLNLLSGRDPDKTSPTFVSMVGLMDDRVELDSSIKYGDPRYNSVLSMMAAKISYENENYIKSTVEDHWKMEFLGSYNFWNDYQEKASTQAFMLRDKTTDHNIIVVAFKGTEPFDADSWLSDVDLSWYELHGVGRTHRGFMKALGLQKNNVGFPKEIDQDDNHPPSAYYAIKEMLKQLLAKDDRARYILTGHSLGGALAILFPAILALHGEKLLLERFEGVYTFGQPRVGDKEFAEYMEQNLIDYNIRYFRLVYSNDIVPRLPYDDKTLMFKHFGLCVFYNSFYEGEIVSEEPNRNYFSPQEAIPMWTNAVWELIRSFVIGKIEGPFYKESTLQKGFRVFGLVVPGISAHSTQDYVNATRLGSPDLFSQHRIRSDE